MNTAVRIIETTEELNLLDFEVPGMPDYRDDAEGNGYAEWLDEALLTFEKASGVLLGDEALRTFKRDAYDIYSC